MPDADPQTLTAVWERQDFTVSFIVNDETKLSIKVPYESTLWSDAGQVPWETAEYSDGTATVSSITYEGETYNNVAVTRHGEGGSYWYSFALGEGDAARSFFACDSSLFSDDSNQPFSYWKMTQGGGGYQILENNTVFTAQFAQDPVYVINVHYRTSEGITVDTSQTVVKQADDVGDGTLAVEFSAPSVIEHYNLDEEAMAAYSVDGTKVAQGAVSFERPGSDGGTWTAKLNIEQVFGESAGQTSYLSIVVTYEPQTVSYVVNYYQQKPDRTGYEEIAADSVPATYASYGDLVEIAEKSHEGFKVSGRSRLALLNGVELVEPEEGSGGDIKWNENSDTFTIDIYYDRASYFIYPLWDSTESSVKAQRVTYGAAIGELEVPQRTGYTFGGWKWYRLDDKGDLEEVSGVSENTIMPAHDLYAVAQWTPASVDFQVVLWLEEADSSSYANAYQVTVSAEEIGTASPVKAGDKLSVSLDGEELVIKNASSQELYRSSRLLKSYVNDAYSDKIDFTRDEYTQFFSYNQQRTQQSPGNISLAEESGDSVSGGQLGDEFTVTVGADGTTSINVYYSRNLYSVDFILSKRYRQFDQVSNHTDVSLGAATWTKENDSGKKVIGFAADGLKVVDDVPASNGWVDTPMTLREENTTDARSPIGRFGEKQLWDGKKNLNVRGLPDHCEV